MGVDGRGLGLRLGRGRGEEVVCEYTLYFANIVHTFPDCNFRASKGVSLSLP